MNPSYRRNPLVPALVGLLLATTLLASLPVGGQQGQAQGDGPLYVNLQNVMNEGCAPDDATFRIKVFLDGSRVATTPVASFPHGFDGTRYASALFGQLYRLDDVSFPADLGFTVEHRSPGGTITTCDAAQGPAETFTYTYDPADRAPENVTGLMSQGDQAHAVRLRVTLGTATPPAPPSVQVGEVTDAAATVRWNTDPDGDASRHVVAWGPSGHYIAEASGPGPGSHRLADLQDDRPYSVRVLRESGLWKVTSDSESFRTQNVAPAQPSLQRSWMEEGGTAHVAWYSQTNHDVDRYEVHMAERSPFEPGGSTLRASVPQRGDGPHQQTSGVPVQQGDRYVLVRTVDEGGLTATSSAVAIGWDRTSGEFRAPPWERPGGDLEEGQADPGPQDPRQRIEGEGWSHRASQCDRHVNESVQVLSDPGASGGAVLSLPHDACRVFLQLAPVEEPARVDGLALRVAGTDRPVTFLLFLEVDGRRILQEELTLRHSDGLVLHEPRWSNQVPAGSGELMITYTIADGPAYADLEIDHLQGRADPPSPPRGDGRSGPSPPPSENETDAPPRDGSASGGGGGGGGAAPPARSDPRPVHPDGRMEAEYATHIDGCSAASDDVHLPHDDGASQGRTLYLPSADCLARFDLQPRNGSTVLERYQVRLAEGQGPVAMDLWVEADGRLVASVHRVLAPGDGLVTGTFDWAEPIPSHTGRLTFGFDMDQDHRWRALEVDYLEGRQLTVPAPSPRPEPSPEPPARPPTVEVEEAVIVDGRLRVHWTVTGDPERPGWVHHFVVRTHYNAHVSPDRWSLRAVAGADARTAEVPVAAHDRWVTVELAYGHGNRTYAHPHPFDRPFREPSPEPAPAPGSPPPHVALSEVNLLEGRLELSWRVAGPSHHIDRFEVELAEAPGSSAVTQRASVAPDRRHATVAVAEEHRWVLVRAVLTNGQASDTGFHQLPWLQAPPLPPVIDNAVVSDGELDITWTLQAPTRGPLDARVHVLPAPAVSPTAATLRSVASGQSGHVSLPVDGSDAYVVVELVDRWGRTATSPPAWIERHGAPQVTLDLARHQGDRLVLEWQGQTPDTAEVTVHAGPTAATASAVAPPREPLSTLVGLNGWVRMETTAQHSDRYVVVKVTWPGGQYVTDAVALDREPTVTMDGWAQAPQDGRAYPAANDEAGGTGAAEAPPATEARDEQLRPAALDQRETDGVTAWTLWKVFGGSAGLGGIAAGVGAAIRRRG